MFKTKHLKIKAANRSSLTITKTRKKDKENSSNEN